MVARGSTQFNYSWEALPRYDAQSRAITLGVRVRNIGVRRNSNSDPTSYPTTRCPHTLRLCYSSPLLTPSTAPVPALLYIHTIRGALCPHCLRLSPSGCAGDAGSEVAQLYVSFPPAAGEPQLLLRDFEKTPLLPPGGAAALTFQLSSEPHLSVWTAATSAQPGWQALGGNFGIAVGSSSRDLRLQHSVRVDV